MQLHAPVSQKKNAEPNGRGATDELKLYSSEISENVPPRDIEAVAKFGIASHSGSELFGGALQGRSNYSSLKFQPIENEGGCTNVFLL